MKTKLILVLMICSTLLLTACSPRSTYEQMEAELEGGNYTIEQANAEAQRLMEEHGLTEEDFEEEPESATPNAMKRCSGEMAGTAYLIYLSDKNAYQKVMASNGGKVYTWLTQFQTCALAEPSEVPKQCSELSQSEYNQHYLSMQQLTEEPMASLMGIKCSNVPYEDSVFIE